MNEFIRSFPMNRFRLGEKREGHPKLCVFMTLNFGTLIVRDISPGNLCPKEVSGKVGPTWSHSPPFLIRITSHIQKFAIVGQHL